MKYLFVLILLFSACKAQDIPTMKLSYVDLDIKTPIDVSCDMYKLLFKSQIKMVKIDKQTDIDSIINLLNNLRIDTSKFIPDVRAELEISYSNKSKIYCLDKKGIYSEGISYFLPDKLLGILKRHMKYVELAKMY